MKHVSTHKQHATERADDDGHVVGVVVGHVACQSLQLSGSVVVPVVVLQYLVGHFASVCWVVGLSGCRAVGCYFRSVPLKLNERYRLSQSSWLVHAGRNWSRRSVTRRFGRNLSGQRAGADLGTADLYAVFEPKHFFMKSVEYQTQSQINNLGSKQFRDYTSLGEKVGSALGPLDGSFNPVQHPYSPLLPPPRPLESISILPPFLPDAHFPPAGFSDSGISAHKVQNHVSISKVLGEWLSAVPPVVLTRQSVIVNGGSCKYLNKIFADTFVGFDSASHFLLIFRKIFLFSFGRIFFFTKNLKNHAQPSVDNFQTRFKPKLYTTALLEAKPMT